MSMDVVSGCKHLVYRQYWHNQNTDETKKKLNAGKVHKISHEEDKCLLLSLIKYLGLSFEA